jgi:hypothetical protein
MGEMRGFFPFGYAQGQNDKQGTDRGGKVRRFVGASSAGRSFGCALTRSAQDDGRGWR